MKIIKTASGKKQIKISKSEWQSIGRTAGWGAGSELKDSYGSIPQHMLESLNMYVEEGVPVGHFLTAVLSNDLFEAMSRGDEQNCAAIKDYVRYIYNYCPGNCWGSKGHVEAWINKGGAKGRDIEPDSPDEPDSSM